MRLEYNSKGKLTSFDQLDPKSGDTGPDSHEEAEKQVHMDDFMKEFMNLADDDIGISRTLKEHYK